MQHQITKYQQRVLATAAKQQAADVAAKFEVPQEIQNAEDV